MWLWRQHQVGARQHATWHWMVSGRWIWYQGTSEFDKDKLHHEAIKKCKLGHFQSKRKQITSSRKCLETIHVCSRDFEVSLHEYINMFACVCTCICIHMLALELINRRISKARRMLQFQSKLYVALKPGWVRYTLSICFGNMLCATCIFERGGRIPWYFYPLLYV